jgi:hypothetical protein
VVKDMQDVVSRRLALVQSNAQETQTNSATMETKALLCCVRVRVFHIITTCSGVAVCVAPISGRSPERTPAPAGYLAVYHHHRGQRTWVSATTNNNNNTTRPQTTRTYMQAAVSVSLRSQQAGGIMFVSTSDSDRLEAR